MCVLTIFSETCDRIRRTDKAVAPIIVDDVETKGIGYDDGAGCESIAVRGRIKVNAVFRLGFIF